MNLPLFKLPLDPYRDLYRLAKTCAHLQTRDPEAAERLYSLIDRKIAQLKTQGCRFRLNTACGIFDLPLDLNRLSYFRPLFNMITHKKIIEARADDTYAVDFDVPFSSEIFAVESGIITAIRNDSTIGGNHPDYAGTDNYLYIYNSNSNLIFCYRHLMPSDQFTLHAPIKIGECIGRVGLTGYVITPHLHFAIYKFKKNHTYLLKSLPIRFDNIS